MTCTEDTLLRGQAQNMLHGYCEPSRRRVVKQWMAVILMVEDRLGVSICIKCKTYPSLSPLRIY